MILPAQTTFHTSIAAALILLGREVVSWPGWPTTEEIFDLAGSGRSQAYAMMARLRELLPTLAGKPGRPASTPAPTCSLLAVSRCIQDYLMRHPGSAHFHRGRYHYLDDFRRFFVGLVGSGQPGEGLSIAELAEASNLPLGTLKSWFSKRLDPETEPEPKVQSLRQEHHCQIMTLYESWEGTFVAFCRMVREEYRLNYGPTAIGTLLHEAGLRRRKKKEKQAVWSPGTFRKLFPGAQWLGDGSTMKIHGIPVRWGDETFAFNLEAILDVDSNALVGMAVSDFEDEAVLLSAYQDAIATTGQAPLALSLDNRPGNHTPGVVEATLETGTALLRTTPGRGQSKAPLEGTFGLFNQELPELVISGEDAREQARSVLKLAFAAWARGRNGKPRRKLGGKSPRDYYRADTRTPAEIAEAKCWFQELRRQQEAMRRTREARADHVKLEFLKQALADLNLSDPDHRLAVALAYYSRDAIVNGIGIYQAKLQLGTVPPGADPSRYLGGIIRNVHEQSELTLAAELHIKNRQRLRDLSLRRLFEQAELLLERSLTAEQLVPALVDRALAAPCAIDYHFWTLRCAETLSGVPVERRPELYRDATRRTAATFRADIARKQSLLARLARVLSE